MGGDGRGSLDLGDEVGIERQLENVLGVSRAFEFGVDHFVGPIPAR